MKKRVVALAAVCAAAVLGAAACGGSDEATGPAAPVDPGGTGASVGAAIPGGGLTVQEAIDSTLPGPLMVAGFVVADGSGSVQLCTALTEAAPPGCGAPALLVEGLDLASVEGLAEDGASGAAWTQDRFSLVGDVEDGVFTVSKTSI